MNPRLHLDDTTLARFCERHHIRRLALFGSQLKDKPRPDSDIDLLVEFEPEARVGLIGFAGMEIELSHLLNRKVDLNTLGFLSPYFRDEVIPRLEAKGLREPFKGHEPE